MERQISIILKLWHKKEYKKINSINELSKNEFKSLEKSVKLICVKDSGQEALRVNNAGTLKAYSSRLALTAKVSVLTFKLKKKAPIAPLTWKCKSPTLIKSTNVCVTTKA